MVLGQVVVDTDDLDAAVAFYAAALDGSEEPLPPESVDIYRRLVLPSGLRLLLHLTNAPAADGPVRRVHLDLAASDPDEAAERLCRLGASRVRVEDERGWRFHVLADPFGHLLCVLPADAVPYAGIAATPGAERGRPTSTLPDRGA